MLLIPNVAALEFLSRTILWWSPYVHLYVEDVPLDRDIVLDDLVESEAPGYAAQLAIGWDTPVIRARRAYTEAEPLLFSRSDGSPSEQAFGYYVTQGMSGPLLWVERFEPAPFPWSDSTDQIYVTVTFTDRSEPRKLTTGL